MLLATYTNALEKAFIQLKYILHTLNFYKHLTSQKSTVTKRIKSDYDSKETYFIFRKCEKADVKVIQSQSPCLSITPCRRRRVRYVVKCGRRSSAEKAIRTQRLGGWVGQRAGVEVMTMEKNPRLCRELNAGRLDSNPLLSRAHNIHPKHTFYTDTSKTCHNFHSPDTTLPQVAWRTIMTKERTSDLILFRM